jgi:hypothetical protein
MPRRRTIQQRTSWGRRNSTSTLTVSTHFRKCDQAVERSWPRSKDSTNVLNLRPKAFDTAALPKTATRYSARGHDQTSSSINRERHDNAFSDYRCTDDMALCSSTVGTLILRQSASQLQEQKQKRTATAMWPTSQPQVATPKALRLNPFILRCAKASNHGFK